MPVSASSLAGVHVPRDQRRLIENTGYSALPIQQAHSVQQEYGYGATNPDYLASYGGGGVYTSPGSATNDLYYVGAYQQYANDNRVNAWHGGGTSTLRRRGRRKVFTFTRICGLIATVHFVLYVFCGPYWLLPGMPPSEFERPEDFIVATNAAEISKLTANLSREADNTEDAQSVCHQLSIRETLTIVTAASDWYFGKLIQNLKSIAQFESRARVVVYDIGLTSDHLFTLQQWLQKWEWPREVLYCRGLVPTLDINSTDVEEMEATEEFEANNLTAQLSASEYNTPGLGRRGIIQTLAFEDIPGHMAIKHDNRAWKVYIISEVAKEYGGAILWLDADNRLTGELLGVREVVKEKHMLAEVLESTIGEWTHNGMVKYLDASELKTKPMLNSGVIGLDASNDVVLHQVIGPWLDCAMVEKCIHPLRASRASHRDEQSSLSIISYKAGLGQGQRPFGIVKYNVTFHKHPNAVLGIGKQKRLDCTADSDLTLTVVLGASGHATKNSDYVTLLLQTIRSILANDTMSRLVIFDLGMDNMQQLRVNDYVEVVEERLSEELGKRLAQPLDKQIVDQKPFSSRSGTGGGGVARRAIMRPFLYGAYPSHMVVGKTHHTFAWKAAALATVIEECEGPVLWLDAGCIVHGQLTEVRRLVKETGFVSTYTTGVIREWTHPRMIEEMTSGMNQKDREELMDQQNLSGSIIGFDASNEDVLDGIFEPWRKCSWDKDCIAPEGADKTNHRYDQAALSLAAQSYGIAAQPSKASLLISVNGRMDSPSVNSGRNMDDWLDTHYDRWRSSFPEHHLDCRDSSEALTIVTAASSHMTKKGGVDSYYVDRVLATLESINSKDKSARVVVYDLGMDPDDQRPLVERKLQEMEDKLNRAEQGASVPKGVRKRTALFPFNFAKHSSAHFGVRKSKQTSFAWKAIVMQELLDRCGGQVVWMDSGSLLSKRSIPELRRRLTDNGFLSFQTAGTIRMWTHPGMLKVLKVMEEDRSDDGIPLLDNPNLSGSLVGFDARSKDVMEQVFEPWVKCAQYPECIDPPGAGRSNHRYDQAALSVIAQRFGSLDLPTKHALGISQMGDTESSIIKCHDDAELTFVVGASKHKDGTYAQRLLDTIASVAQQVGVQVIVFDLGMEKLQREQIENALVGAAPLPFFISEFKSNEYPEHFRMGTSQTYAWRPALMDLVMEECKGPVVWVNAGVRIVGDNALQTIRHTLAIDGFIATSRYVPAQSLSQQGTADYVRGEGYPLDGTGLLLDGNIVGFNTGNRATLRRLFVPWNSCAQQKDCIAPPGATNKNHRFDMSVLSLLACSEEETPPLTLGSMGLARSDFSCVGERSLITVVSAVSRHNAGKSIQGLIEILPRIERSSCPANLIVYDVGLDEEQKGRVRGILDEHRDRLSDLPKSSRSAILRTFPFSEYPEHFKYSLQTFAWKGAVLDDALTECGGSVVWIDPTSTLLEQVSLCEVLEEVSKRGFYAKNTESMVGGHAHADMIKLLKTVVGLSDGDIDSATLLDTGMIGFDSTHSEVMKRVFVPWAACLFSASCSLPGNTKKPYHCHEASISILVHAYAST